MWKKAFVILLSFDLLIAIGAAVWWSTLPVASSANNGTFTKSAQIQNPAKVQLSIGQDAVNSYLTYALSEQKDVQNVLSYAKVGFNQNWNVQLGVKLADKVVAFDVTLVPTVLNGNLQLHVTQADFGQVPIPVSALFLVFRHLPWPQWIAVDAATSNINLNFRQRPQNPYGVQVLQYDEQTKLLTLQITIAPKSLANATKS